MALQNFKNIINNKAYLINSKDRQIFEEGDYASFFGFGTSDTIEFIVYDANDNQLEQSNFGKVRYIPLTNENIKDYILLPDGTLFQALNFPKEYFVDIERLLREAGYDNGIFKTQVTLINTRVGDNRKDNKLWISEISPSRTEVRLLPLKKPTNQNFDLEERFKLFVSDKEFRDDTIQFALAFLEKINPSIVDSFLKTNYSDAWVERMNNEYRLGDIDEFSARVYRKFLESAIYEFTNRYSDINSTLYGKQRPTKPVLRLSKDEVKSKCSSLLLTAIDFYLSKPNIKNQSDFEIATNESMDEVGQVLQTRSSDVEIQTPLPEIKTKKVIKIFQKDKTLELEKKIKKQITIIETDSPPPIYTPVEQPVELPPFYGGGGGRSVTNEDFIQNINETGIPDFSPRNIGPRPTQNFE